MYYVREPGFTPVTSFARAFAPPIVMEPLSSFVVLRYLNSNPGPKTTRQVAAALDASVPNVGRRLGYLFVQKLVDRRKIPNKESRSNLFEYWPTHHAKTQ